MSKIVAFRDRIVATIKEAIPEFRGEVDWYDGLFDEKDIEEWALRVPCAYVAVMSERPSDNHSTGELLTDLRCIVVIIDQDLKVPRDADARVWKTMEDISTLAHHYQFKDPNVGPACGVKLKRLIDPKLRREGIASGVVEWHTNLTLGRNTALEAETVYDNGQALTTFPKEVFGQAQPYNANGTGIRERVDLSYPDEAFAPDPETP